MDEVVFPVVFFDGETELDAGHLSIRPSLKFNAYWSMLSRLIGMPANQILSYLVHYDSELWEEEGYRRIAITKKVDFTALVREKDCYIYVVQKRKRRERRRRKDRTVIVPGVASCFPVPENFYILPRDLDVAQAPANNLISVVEDDHSFPKTEDDTVPYTCTACMDDNDPESFHSRRSFVSLFRFSRKEVTGQWSELPGDLLEEIGKLLFTHGDYIRCGAVCRAWRSSLPNRPKLEAAPLLILSSSIKESYKFPRLFNIVDGKIMRTELSSNIPSDFVYCGSCHGWLVILSDDIDLSIFHPLSGVQISLPPLSTLPEIKERNGGRVVSDRGIYVHPMKIFLSSSPLDDNCVAMITYRCGRYGRLAFTELHGRGAWMNVLTRRCSFSDITFRDGEFYAIDARGRLFYGEVEELPEVVEAKVEPLQDLEIDKFYLAWSDDDELFMVDRQYAACCECCLRAETDHFRVYKMGWGWEGWCEVESLGDNVIFLGFNSTEVFGSHKFPGLKSNCIYYTCDELEDRGVMGVEIGVFDMEDGHVKDLAGYSNVARNGSLFWPSPVWVLPSFS